MTAYNVLDLEDHLILAQVGAPNLTTFESYPLPGRLSEIAYPLQADGSILPPELLDIHSKDTNFMVPNCFHGRKSLVLVTQFGQYDYNVSLICGAYRLCNEQCGFHVNVSAILRNPDKVTFRKYRSSTSSPYGLMDEISKFGYLKVYALTTGQEGHTAPSHDDVIPFENQSNTHSLNLRNCEACTHRFHSHGTDEPCMPYCASHRTISGLPSEEACGLSLLCHTAVSPLVVSPIQPQIESPQALAPSIPHTQAGSRPVSI